MKLLPFVSVLFVVLLLPLTSALGQFGPPHGPHGFHPAPPPPRPSFGISIGVRPSVPVVAPYTSPGPVFPPPPVYSIDSRYPSEWQIALDPYGYRNSRFFSAASDGEAYLMRPLDMNANCLLFQAVRGIPNVQYTPLSASVASIANGAQFWFVCIAYPRNVMHKPYYVTVQVAQGAQYPYGFQLISIDPTAYTDPNGYYVNSSLGETESVSENVSTTIPSPTFDSPARSDAQIGAPSGEQTTPNYTTTPYSGKGTMNGTGATGTPTPAVPTDNPPSNASRAVQSVLENAETAVPTESGSTVTSTPLYSDDVIQLTPPLVEGETTP